MTKHQGKRNDQIPMTIRPVCNAEVTVANGNLDICHLKIYG